MLQPILLKLVCVSLVLSLPVLVLGNTSKICPCFGNILCENIDFGSTQKSANDKRKPFRKLQTFNQLKLSLCGIEGAPNGYYNFRLTYQYMSNSIIRTCFIHGHGETTGVAFGQPGGCTLLRVLFVLLYCLKLYFQNNWKYIHNPHTATKSQPFQRLSGKEEL